LLKFIFIFIFIIEICYSNIIYDKNGILITDIEVNGYKTLYKNNYGNNITNNQVIKNIVIIKNTMNFLQKNNPVFLSNLDLKIEKEFSKEIFNDKIILNFIRFQKIRNEFISEYFKNTFNIEDLENIFSNFNSLKIPLSKNNCLTIEKLYEVRDNKQFIKNFFENLKNNKQNLILILDDETYNVCINEKFLSNLEKKIIEYIQNKTEKDFNDFIYGKTN